MLIIGTTSRNLRRDDPPEGNNNGKIYLNTKYIIELVRDTKTQLLCSRFDWRG